MQQLRNQDYTEGFTTQLNKTQERILKYVKDMQPVCQKIVQMKAVGKSDSVIGRNLRMLEEREFIKREEIRANTNTVTITKKGKEALKRQ